MVHALVLGMSALLAVAITYLMPVVFPTQASAVAALDAHCATADVSWVEPDAYSDGFVAVCQWEK